jgi:hypothetical protein
MTCYRIWCLNSRRALRPPRPRQRCRLRPHALPTLSSFSGGSALPRHRSSSSGRSPGLLSAQMPNVLPHMCGHEASAVPDSTGREPPHLVLDAVENCVSAVSRGGLPAGHLIQGGAASHRKSCADDFGDAVVAVESLIATPGQGVRRIAECQRNDRDPEISAVESRPVAGPQ